MNKFMLALLGGFVAMSASIQTAPAATLPYQDAVLLEPSLVHYWDFDQFNGGGKVTDLKNPANAAAELEPFFGASVSGGGSTAGGLSLGSAATLDGSNDIFRTGVMGGANPISAHIIEFWMRDADNAAPAFRQSYMFNFASNTQGTSGQNTPGILYDFDDGPGGDGRNTVEVNDPATRSNGGPVITDNNWHHVVLAYYGDGAGNGAKGPGGVTVNRQEAYLDGAQVPGYVVGRYFPRFAQVMFLGGADMNGAGGTTRNPFHGQMDEAALYQFDNGISVGQVEAAVQRIAGHASAAGLQAPGMTAYTWQVLKDNPRFYWNFNEGGLTDGAKDLVRGQANDTLAPQGDAHRGFSGTANLGYAATLDGSGDFFHAAALNDYEMPGAWAIEMWVKADGSLAGSRGDYLMNAYGVDSNNPGFIYDFGVGGDNKIELFRGNRTAGGGPSIDDNEWHHLVATFYGNGTFGVADRVDMAIDGVVTTVPRNGFSAGFALNTELFIGAALSNGANAFQGQIDEVAFYDLSGLTEAQVAARTQQIADHYGLASRPGDAPLRYADRNSITYTYDVGTPSPSYPDSTGRELVDGMIGSTTTDLSDRNLWVGIDTVDPQITFDLGHEALLDSIFIDYLGGTLAGIHAPDSVLMSFSADGITFGDSMTFTDFNNSTHTTAGANAFYNRRLVADVSGTLARYVRMNFANDGQWTFLGEVQFVERVPEPATLTLLVLGGLGLLLAGRRRGRISDC